MTMGISRRAFLGALTLAAGGGRALAAGNTRRPNIIVMVADDLGYGDLGCYGCPDIRTPHLDRMAREGLRYTDAYASAPVCSPTRVAIITGQYQQRLGDAYEDYMGAGSPAVDPEKHPSVARYLKAAGYRTACYGKWNISGAPDIPANAYGFDHWVGIQHNCNYFTHLGYDFADGDWSGPNRLMEDGKPLEKEGYITEILADYTVDLIEKAGNGPFFIYLPWQAPHSPLQGPGEDPLRPHVPKGITPAMRPTYIEIVEEMDRQTGRIMAALKDQGLDEKTLVIFTSDNGGHRAARNLPLKGWKQDLDEGGIRVPMMLRWPGTVPAGKVVKRSAISMDITATVIAAAGAMVPEGVARDGEDLLRPGKGDAPRCLYWRRRTINHGQESNVVRAKAVRQGRWKYLNDIIRNREQLYDLEADPEEARNLFVAQPERAAGLKAMLEAWEAEVSPGKELYGESGA